MAHLPTGILPPQPTLLVGSPNAGYAYAETGAIMNKSWMALDGVNPPLFPLIRLVDQTTGIIYAVGVNNGVLAIIDSSIWIIP